MDWNPENNQDGREDTLDDYPEAKRESDLTQGMRVNRYIVLGLVGKGGMGAVYKAYDPDLDRNIALKILTLTPQEGETVSLPQARLMREAQALAKLNHPNVVSVYDVGAHENGVYIAMEYVEGRTLRQWLEIEKPTLDEVIEIMLAAGRGLLAAHREGIVHRDFKPENLVVGSSGQAKVLDFGLARAANLESLPRVDVEQPSLTLTDAQSTDMPSTQSLTQPLTQVGILIGTPVYMAPEHFLFQELDEKTDQFSFCLTLFEALYHKRPFGEKNKQELEENVTQGRIQLPNDASVPDWIRDIALRGLAVSKSDRYESMEQLLDDLAFDPQAQKSRKRKIQLLILCFMFAAAFFFGIGSLFFDRTGLCTGADNKLQRLWNPQKLRKIEQSFAKSFLSYANDSFARTKQRLDEYFHNWRAEYTEACEATRLRQEQPQEVMFLKIACLDRHLDSARALVKVLAEADKTVVGRSVQAVASLSGFANCHDIDALQARVQSPADLALSAKVEGLRQRLAEVEALSKTGKYQSGLALATQLVEQAKAVDYQPVQAEALYWLAEMLEREGDYQRAETTLHDAATAAGECSHGTLAAKALVLLVWVLGINQDRKQEALSMGLSAKVLADLSGQDETIRARLYNNLGVVFRQTGDYDKALTYQLRALALRQKIRGRDHPSLAPSLNNIGNIYQNQGRHTKALEYYRKTLTILEKTLGRGHPDLTYPLNNLGELFSRQGAYKKAMTYYTRALSIRESSLGPDHPDLGSSYIYLAAVLEKLDKHDQALRNYEKAQAIWEQTLGSEHANIALPLSGIGNVLLSQGKHVESCKPLKQLVRLCEKKKCEPKSWGQGLFTLARAQLAGGAKKLAFGLAKRALNVFQSDPNAFTKEINQVAAWLAKQKH